MLGQRGDEDDSAEVPADVALRRSQARQRQITIGKSRPEYKVYSQAVPYHQRTEHMPSTPDPHAKISKRAFDRELACWRRGLHVWSSHCEQMQMGGDMSPQKGEEKMKWADYSLAKDWSPNTESTRANSQASSPDSKFSPTASGSGHAGSLSHLSNVKLNLFEHLSPPTQAAQAPPMPQMLPTTAPTPPWDFPANLNAAAQIMAAAMPMMQFQGVDQQQQQQQQCPYTMNCGWGQPADQWMQNQQPTMLEATPQMQQPQQMETMPAMQCAPNAVDAQMPVPPAVMWQGQPVAIPRPQPGTPRDSQNQAGEAPSTPLHRVNKSATSPAITSPWLRTPSPGPMHYSGGNIGMPVQAVQQPQACPRVPENTDPWAGATLMVATKNYYAEADEYLSVASGSPVRAILDRPAGGDAKCQFPTYVWCSQNNQVGWVPQQLLWRCYVDDAGRRWASDDASGIWCWVDEMENGIL